MHSNFLQALSAATQLTRNGNLQEAVRAIKTALSQPQPSVDRHVVDPMVVDVAARVIPSNGEPKAKQEPQSEAGKGKFLALSFSGKDGARDYKLFVPPSYCGQALPLVVMLHGCTQDPDDFAAGTRMNEAALARGMFVLYPAQAQGANPSRCWNWFKSSHQTRGRGEPAILAAMVAEVIAKYKVDSQRVYVAGLSAGGAMAAILGEAYPEVFAAIGVHSGLPVGAARDVASAFSAMKNGAGKQGESSAAPPTIVFHGDKDNTVHHINGQQIAQARSGDANGSTESLTGICGRDCTHIVYRDRMGHVLAEHWVVHGAGHAWCGGSPAGSFTDVLGPSATDEMLRFFVAHGHPTENVRTN